MAGGQELHEPRPGPSRESCRNEDEITVVEGYDDNDAPTSRQGFALLRGIPEKEAPPVVGGQEFYGPRPGPSRERSRNEDEASVIEGYDDDDAPTSRQGFALLREIPEKEAPTAVGGQEFYEPRPGPSRERCRDEDEAASVIRYYDSDSD